MRAVAQLVVSCAVLGAGVALLLLAALGADGYSMLVSGLSLTWGLPFWLVNLGVGIVLIGLAWWRGRRPGLGTLLQPIVVGLTVSGLLAVLAEPEQWWTRAAVLAVSFPVLALGVAGYLAVDAGAGPAEAAGLALDPPLPFALSYSLVQGGGALVGWWCGAALGPGTVLVIVGLGPLVTAFGRRMPQPRLRRRAAPVPQG